MKMLLSRFFHFVFDLSVTLILWFYFMFGYLFILLFLYLPVYVFAKNRAAALQRLNHIHLKIFFALTKLLVQTARARDKIHHSGRCAENSFLSDRLQSFILSRPHPAGIPFQTAENHRQAYFFQSSHLRLVFEKLRVYFLRIRHHDGRGHDQQSGRYQGTSVIGRCFIYFSGGHPEPRGQSCAFQQRRFYDCPLL